MIPLTATHDWRVGVAMIVVGVVWVIPSIVVYVRTTLRGGRTD